MLNNPILVKISGTCLIKKRIGGVLQEKCRFGFPQKVTATTILNPIPEDGFRAIGEKAYYIRRKPEEKMINVYNLALSLGWKGNIDVQYVAEPKEGLFNYVASYVSKGESKSKDRELSYQLFHILFRNIRNI
jgi:hypothetical protein